jgi:hypothetical protein
MRLIDADALIADIYTTIEDSGCVNHEKEIIECVMYADVVAAVPAVSGGWISVKDKLPEIDMPVLVQHSYNQEEYGPITIGRLYQPSDKRRKPYWMFISYCCNDVVIYNNATDFICPGNEFVTRWMKLPEPLK